MRFRLRLGPFTFGCGGTRLSIWSSATGVSAPLSKTKGRTFGKIGVGPVSSYFGGSSFNPVAKQNNQAEVSSKQRNIGFDEDPAIEALGSDWQFLNKLQSYGMPWRGVQERIKGELPEGLVNRDDVAYKLVPKAMDSIFGRQNTAWKSEKRPSRSNKGFTTWILIIKTAT